MGTWVGLLLASPSNVEGYRNRLSGDEARAGKGARGTQRHKPMPEATVQGILRWGVAHRPVTTLCENALILILVLILIPYSYSYADYCYDFFY